MKKNLLAFCLFLMAQQARAQVNRDSDLYQTVLSLDSLLFSVGFNICDLSKFENLLSDDFEFFHDKDGISSEPDFIKSMRNGLCPVCQCLAAGQFHVDALQVPEL